MWHYGTIAAVVLTVLAFIYWRMERKTKKIVSLEIENRALKNDNDTLRRISDEWQKIDKEAKEDEAKRRNLSPANRHTSL